MKRLEIRVEPRAATVIAMIMACTIATAALGATYHVGPGQPYANLQALPSLAAGDLVLIDGGGPAYPGNVDFLTSTNGTPALPVTLRGVTINGHRPIINGGSTTIRLAHDYYLLENVEITSGTMRGILTAAAGIVIRDCLVHDCPNQGIVASGNGGGDLLIEFTEVHHCGSGTQNHQVYVSSDNDLHPTATFRMQFCYVHNANGGSNVKSRCSRNEIYYNWIEGALYQELELVGADPGEQTTPPETVREDSDIVGNILVKTGPSSAICRVGGDGTGASDGRYRVVNNTCVLFDGTQPAFRHFDVLESIEYHNNVFFRVAGGPVRIYSETLSVPPRDVAIAGSNNWVPTGATFVPAQWTGTLTGAAPGVANASGFDFTPTPAGALHDAGNPAPSPPTGFPFPNPLFPPAFHPPFRAALPAGTQQSRPTSGTIDIGAVEFAPPCPADINHSGTVNVDDLLSVITGWGACANPCPPHCAADIAPAGGNCAVNVDDLLQVITHWGPCP